MSPVNTRKKKKKTLVIKIPVKTVWFSTPEKKKKVFTQKYVPLYSRVQLGYVVLSEEVISC